MSYHNEKNKLIKIIDKEYPIQDKNLSIFSNTIASKLLAKNFLEYYDAGNINNTKINFNKFKNINLFQRIILIVTTLMSVLYCLVQIIFSRNQNIESKQTLCAVYGLPIDQIKKISTIEITNFFNKHLYSKRTNVKPIYLVQIGFNKSHFSTTKNFKTVRHIGVHILVNSKNSKTKNINRVIERTYKWLKLQKNYRLLALVGLEFIIDLQAFNNLNSQKVDSLVTTQSQMLVLPIAFELLQSTKRTMFWYSDNSQRIYPIKQSKSEKISDYSYLKHQNIDNHVVWTRSWAKNLGQISKKNVLVSGPILFRNIEGVQKYNHNNKLKKCITIFDVTPKMNNNNHNFYSTQNMMNFLNDIEFISSRYFKEFDLQIKPKRKYTSGDDSRYINFIKKLSYKVQIKSPETDIIEVINNSNLIICIPFTSPAILAVFLKIPTFYYVPNDQFSLPLKKEGIKVITGRENLKREMYELLYNKP